MSTERTERLREIMWDALWGNHDGDESTACTWAQALDNEADMGTMVPICIDAVRRIEALLDGDEPNPLRDQVADALMAVANDDSYHKTSSYEAALFAADLILALPAIAVALARMSEEREYHPAKGYVVEQRVVREPAGEGLIPIEAIRRAVDAVTGERRRLDDLERAGRAARQALDAHRRREDATPP